MLNFGIIGDIKSLEPYIRLIQKMKNVQITGKSSVGINVQPNSLQFTIPEFNRIELIGRSDALLINNFSLFPFNILCDMIRKSKHIFATEYPKLSVEECAHLVKLTREAKTTFQIVNPFYYLPAMQWLNSNIKLPAYLDITYFNNSFEKKNTLFSLLLMLKLATGINPKRISVLSFQPKETQTEFNNLRLEFGDASVVNLNYGKADSVNEFKIKAFTNEQHISLNLHSKSYSCNNSPVGLKSFSSANEFDDFIDTVQGKNKQITEINDYLDVLQAFEKINKKLIQFSGE